MLLRPKPHREAGRWIALTPQAVSANRQRVVRHVERERGRRWGHVRFGGERDLVGPRRERWQENEISARITRVRTGNSGRALARENVRLRWQRILVRGGDDCVRP